MIRVMLPYHLRVLAQISGEIQIQVESPVTQSAVFDALEARFPMLSGTIRDYATQKRRAYLRIYACEQDLSHDDPNTPLPAAVAEGKEPFIVMSAISGG